MLPPPASRISGTQLAEGVGGGDVEIQHLGEVFGRHFQRIIRPAAAHVVDQMGDSAHLLDALANQYPALFGIVDVAGDGQGAPTKAAHLLGHRLHLVQRACRAHTSAPASAYARAIARPMPRPLPVTMATLPSRWKRCKILMGPCSVGSAIDGFTIAVVAGQGIVSTD
jgi:hypothetical protein